MRSFNVKIRERDEERTENMNELDDRKWNICEFEVDGTKIKKIKSIYATRRWNLHNKKRRRTTQNRFKTEMSWVLKCVSIISTQLCAKVLGQQLEKILRPTAAVRRPTNIVSNSLLHSKVFLYTEWKKPQKSITTLHDPVLICERAAAATWWEWKSVKIILKILPIFSLLIHDEVHNSPSGMITKKSSDHDRKSWKKKFTVKLNSSVSTERGITLMQKTFLHNNCISRKMFSLWWNSIALYQSSSLGSSSVVAAMTAANSARKAKKKESKIS